MEAKVMADVQTLKFSFALFDVYEGQGPMWKAQVLEPTPASLACLTPSCGQVPSSRSFPPL